MKRTFVCASSRIKHYVQPFIQLPWDACSRPYVCLYCAKNYYINYKNVLNEKHLKYEQKVGMLLQKRADTRVGISSMRKSIYSAGHQKSKKCIFFHSMYIFSVILHAIDKQDIST